MAGDKQHYIPQAVLRAFRFNPKGKVAQVHVFRADRDYSSSTEGVAAEKFFFSGRVADHGETLDAIMTRHENGPFNDDLCALAAAPVGPVDADLASRVVGHLSGRNHHLRGVMRSGAALLGDLVDRLFGGSDQIANLLGAGGPSPTPRFRKAFAEGIAGNALFASLGLPEPGLESLAFMMLRENRGSFGVVVDAAKSLASAFREQAPQIARNAHLKALNTSLVPEGRTDVFRSCLWRIVEVSGPTFILPDFIALAFDGEGKAGTILNFDEESFDSILLPLSPTRMLVGERGPRDRDLTAFNAQAVPHCLEFFVSAFRSDALKSLAPLIGSRVLEPIQEGLAEAAAEFRAELEMPATASSGTEIRSWRNRAADNVELQTDFLDPDSAARLARILEQLMSLAGGRFAVGALRKIVAYADYDQALASINRGRLGGDEPVVRSAEGWSAAYNVPIEEDGALGIVMVLQADTALMLLDEDDLLFASGASIVLAQLARIGADSLLGTVFAEGIMVGDAHDRLLLPQAVTSWKSFLVAGYQCLFSADLRPFYRDHLLEEFSALNTRLVEHRRAYRVHGDVDAFLRTVIGEASAVLNAAAAAAASLADDPDEAGIAEFKTQLELLEWANWFELLTVDLSSIWSEGSDYPDQEAFLVLDRHIERLLVTGAIFLWDDGSPFGRVEVPLWSDWQWLVEQQSAAARSVNEEQLGSDA